MNRSLGLDVNTLSYTQRLQLHREHRRKRIGAFIIASLFFIVIASTVGLLSALLSRIVLLDQVFQIGIIPDTIVAMIMYRRILRRRGYSAAIASRQFLRSPADHPVVAP
ncbi:MAG: hypothetical protein KDA96_25940 [Planctomycetaceae bacterium]|nr:hypothetical protein [Planctomycetaceae bacterium]